MPFTVEERKNIAAKIEQKGATLPCSRCGRLSFTLLENYANIQLQENVDGGIVLGGPFIPTVMVACTNCGNVNFHAIAAIGFSPTKGVEKK